MNSGRRFGLRQAADQHAATGRRRLVAADEATPKVAAVTVRLTRDRAHAVIGGDADRSGWTVPVGGAGSRAHPQAEVGVVGATVGAIAIGRADRPDVMTLCSHRLTACSQQHHSRQKREKSLNRQVLCLLLGQERMVAHLQAGESRAVGGRTGDWGAAAPTHRRRYGLSDTTARSAPRWSIASTRIWFAVIEYTKSSMNRLRFTIDSPRVHQLAQADEGVPIKLS